MPTFMSKAKLFPQKLMDAIPRLYSQEGIKDPKVVAKFFDAMGSSTFYVVEYDGDDLFFGFVNLGDPECAELGNFSKSEIVSGCRMFERDLWWLPKPLSEVVRSVKR